MTKTKRFPIIDETVRGAGRNDTVGTDHLDSTGYVRKLIIKQIATFRNHRSDEEDRFVRPERQASYSSVCVIS
jgi:hypothetical protein